MVARMGTRPAANSGQQQNQNAGKVILTLLICAVALPADWSCIASLSVLSIGTNRGEPKKQIAWSMLWAAVYAVVYFFAIDKYTG